jgi:hypothetical protein
MYRDNYTLEVDKEDLEIVKQYTKEDKLSKDWHGLITYDLVQSGYPYADHGEMIPQVYSGTDEKGILLPPHGKWVKLEDVLKLIEELNDNT